MRQLIPAQAALEAELERLKADHLVVLELEALEDLLRDPTEDGQVPMRGPHRPGLDDLVATLAAARRLPHELTVRVVLPAGAAPEPAVIAEMEAAIRRRAAWTAGAAWRDGMAIRSMGMSQLPGGTVVAVIAWIVAFVAGTIISQASGWELGIIAVVGGLAMTVAWVVSWMIVEYVMVDWRLNGRRALAYDLLSRARLEVTTEPG